MEEFDEEWYYHHKKDMLASGKYYDPCDGCMGEDCACCSYGRGY